MSEDDIVDLDVSDEERPPDPQVSRARADILTFVEANESSVFYSRQLEVHFEDTYFHWVSNRAIRELISLGKVAHGTYPLRTGNQVHLLWNPRFRYYKRSAKRVAELVASFSENEFARLVGYTGEMLVLEAFARTGFSLVGRNVRSYKGRSWELSSHDLDFIWARDGFTYGVEVKNALGYIREDELKLKIRLCEHLGITPVFVVRMMPKTWINMVREEGGFTLILKYQLYPLSHVQLARAVREELGLPVDAPRALWDSTIGRFTTWHEDRV